MRHWYVSRYESMNYSLSALLQDIIADDDIKLDWFFKVSLINDLVQVKQQT